MLRDWGQSYGLRSNESVNHISLVLCVAPEVSVLSSKSRSWRIFVYLLALHIKHPLESAWR